MLINQYSKRILLRASVSFAALVAASLGGVSLASAADFTAGTDQQLRDAIAAANASPDAASTITLTNSFSVSSTPSLATSSKSITIKTQGFTLSGQGTPGISSSIAFSGAFAGGTLTLEGTYKGGDQTATVPAGVGLFVNGMTPGGNGGAIVNNGTIRGGDATVANSSGSIGVSLAGGVTLTNNGSIAGGIGSGAGSGNNMAGVSLNGGNTALTNNLGATINGGNSTQGGFTGAGVFMNGVAGPVTFTNYGTVQGGSDLTGVAAGKGAIVGQGGSNTIVNFGTLTGGDRAAAIHVQGSGWIASITNSGTIRAGTGSTDAIVFSQTGAGRATLELQAGSTIIGNVRASPVGTNDTLRLGGAADSSFDASAIGAAAQYQNFDIFEKVGTGTWTLSGSTGTVTPWTIRQGTLSISADAQLGDPSAALTFMGGTLRMTTAAASTRAVNLAANGTVETDGTTSGLFGVISGVGGLIKTGTGTLVLGNANTYLGGTTISGGTVSVLADNNLGDSVGDLTFNGGVLQVGGNTFSSTARTINWGANGGGFTILDASNNFTVSQALNGPGGLVKSGAGILTLTAANAYTGTTTINQGALQLGNGGASGAIAGNIINNGALGFNRSDVVTFAGTISGTGGVLQTGGGTTILTGANSYKRETAVGSGTLLVNGDQTAATGATLVLPNATLGGSGIIGGDVTILDLATLAPGNAGTAPGTLTINGNLNLSEASRLAYNFGQVNVAGGALNDLVKVGGNLVLDGKLNVTLAAGGAFDAGVYRIASYGGALANNGLDVGSLPAGTPAGSVFVQTAVDKQ
ncbi:MAG TPA: autotransporter-associated beta strand repeat-containing protein, partial [Mesorhizobium sp.]|uniref:beta strand repeat-containing protein n=1 Tax=Mesorhizobium sp. TaxID=1871066 RepID=UPI002DDD3A4C